LTNDTFSGNNATGGSGGNGAQVSSGGNAYGGGVAVAAGTATLTNDTLSGNTAIGGMGGNGNFVTSQLTVVGGFGFGGGLWVGNSSTSLANTLIAQNTVIDGPDSSFALYRIRMGLAVDPDVCGTVAASDHDLIGNGTGSNLTNGSNGDQVASGAPFEGTLAESFPVIHDSSTTSGLAVGQLITDMAGLLPAGTFIMAVTNYPDGSPSAITLSQRASGTPGTFADDGFICSLYPNLGPLQNNGGPLAGAPGSQQVAPTLALLPGSPAIDAGNNALYAPPAVPSGVSAAVQSGGDLVSDSTTYYYRVSAFNLDGESPPSTEVSTGPVTGFISVTLSWNAVPGAIGYKVYGRTQGGELFLGTSPAVASPSFRDTGVPGFVSAPPIPVTTTDQRGFARQSGSAVDIGAFELEQPQFSINLPNGQFGSSYSQTVVTATGGASAPFTYTVNSGALPPGLTLQPDGTLSGTPTQVGTFPFTITATDSDNDYGSQAYTVSVAAVSTSLSVSASSPSPVYGQSVITATVTTPAGAAIPTSSDGTVTFYNGATQLGSAQTLSGSPATATIVLPPGSYTISAVYSGDSGFLASQSGVLPVTVSPAKPNVSVNPVNLSYGAALADSQLKGTATWIVAGKQVNVPGTFTYTSAAGTVLGVGNGQSEDVTFKPTDSTDYMPVATTVTVNVGLTPTSISLSASSTSPVYGESVTLTATVTTPAGDALPNASDGTVTFYDGGNMLGNPEQLSDNPAAHTATATLSIALTTGSHTITAVYSGDSGFLTSQSGVQPTTLPQPVKTPTLDRPEDVAVDSHGNLFIACPYEGEVLKVAPDGTGTQVGDGFYGPVAVAMDGQDNLYVTDNTAKLWEVPNDGAGTPIAFGSGYYRSPGVAQEDAGDTFTADPSGNEVVEKKVGVGSVYFHSGLYQPLGVDVDAAGDLLVADTGDNRIAELPAGLTVTVSPAPTSVSVSASNTAPVYGQSVTFTATVTTATGAIPTASDGTVTFYDDGTQLGSPQALSGNPAAATLPNMMLAAGSHTITAVYSGDSNYLSSQSGVEPTSMQTVVKAGFLLFPQGVAVDAAGDLFIADSNGNRVAEVTPTGTQTSVGSGLNSPYDVAVDSQGDVFIVESSGFLQSQILKVKPDGTQTTVATTGVLGGVAVDSSGDLFASATEANEVLEYTPSGAVHTIGSGLVFPEGVAVDSQGDLFIADYYNNRVVEVTPSGTQTTFVSGLNKPSYVAVDGQGDVFIAETSSGQVVEVKADGTQATVASGLSNPQGVAVDGGGDVFIADSGNDRVVEVKVGLPVQVAPTAPGVAPPAYAAGISSQVALWAARGQPLAFTLSDSAPLSSDQGAGFTYQIAWGDGTMQTVRGPSGMTLTHVYAAADNYQVQATAATVEGYTSPVTTSTVAIGVLALEHDPIDPTKIALFVGGSSGPDNIRISGDANDSFKVVINGVSYGSRQVSGHVFVYSQGGNDTITYQTRTSDIPAFLFAGSGKNTIDASGSSANNVLVGGGGKDLLIGSSRSRDLLIAGQGGATLRGNGGQDILIGGTTDYDNNLVALGAIMAEWGRTDVDFQTRIAHLNGTLAGGANGGELLTAATVHDNGVRDNLFGGGGLDWLFAKLSGPDKDVQGRLSSGDVITGL
jgi:hypothetical protein